MRTAAITIIIIGSSRTAAVLGDGWTTPSVSYCSAARLRLGRLLQLAGLLQRER